MLTYTSRRELYGKLTNNDNSNNLSLGDVLMNNATKSYCSSNGGKWWFLEDTATQDTVASQQAYVIPQDVRKIIDLYVTVGTTVYSPSPIENAGLWKRILQSNLGTGDRALYYFRSGNNILLSPTPASASNDITITYRKKVIDLSIADYTTGTLALTNGDATVTGSGTTFSEAMVGRYLQVTGGDMQWYEIASYTDSTHIELVQLYEGVDISGASYTIGQASPIPEEYQEMIVFKAVSDYWAKEGDSRATLFAKMALEKLEIMREESNERVEGAYIEPVNSMIFRDPNIPEPEIPTSSFI